VEREGRTLFLPRLRETSYSVAYRVRAPALNLKPLVTEGSRALLISAEQTLSIHHLYIAIVEGIDVSCITLNGDEQDRWRGHTSTKRRGENHLIVWPFR